MEGAPPPQPSPPRYRCLLRPLDANVIIVTLSFRYLYLGFRLRSQNPFVGESKIYPNLSTWEEVEASGPRLTVRIQLVDQPDGLMDPF
ncbi:hypothetical protein MUK42_27652 [Musa troglodytarum]|uniref:Uncharacterized protein n=1 Tax=Musa troglodytarum TaxID=320322 RepID=A0A9E7K8E7_9LILI|nr:hypothetical protein MUK42_27652 [Musa troglodytarum]